MKNILYILVLIISFIAGYFSGKLRIDSKIFKPNSVNDTTLVQKWDTKIAKDTVIKFIDRIVLKEISPSEITYQKIDTSYLKHINNLNTFLDVSKVKDSLKVFTVNRDKSMVKEFVFPSSLPEFRLVAKNDDVLYAEKRNIFKFEGFKIGAGVLYELNEIRPKYLLELKAGFDLLYKFDLDLFINSEFQTGVKIYYNF